MKTKLTKAEEARLVWYKEEGMRIGSDCTPINRAKAEGLIRQFYALGGHKPPATIVWGDSPFALQKKYPFLSNEFPLTGSAEAYWIQFYLFGEELIPDVYSPDQKKKLALWSEIMRETFFFWPYAKACFLSEKPTEIHFEPDRETPRLHRIGGPSVAFKDGAEIYNIRGVRVTKAIAMGHFSAQEILTQQNNEVQRVMLDMFGEAKFIEEIGATPIHSDQFGELFRVNFPNDEPLILLKVVDATPQPDGIHKIYWLRINGEHYNGDAGRCAHAAVASTWRNDDGTLYFDSFKDYNPTIET